MEIIFLLGRVLFAAIFINSGIAHLRNADSMGQYAEMKGAPGGRDGVIATGVMILVGGILILLGLWADIGALLVFAFLLSAAYYMHAFWKVDDPQERAGEQAHFMKDIALAGGALIIIYLYWALGDFADVSVSGPLLFK